MYKKNILLSMLVSSILVAQNIELSPLTISSTAIQTNELRSTDIVEIYTSEDIENSNVQDIYEFLNQQTSVTTVSGYGNDFMQKIDMRGFGTTDGYENMVITINGRRLNNIDLVSQLLGAISPSSIDKIEIIKSSGIVVGGDGANSGVINITTKKSNQKEISFYMGTYGMMDSSIYLGHTDEELSVSLSAEVQESDPIRSINSSSPIDKNKLATATLTMNYFATDKLELRLGLSSTNTDVIYSGSLTEAQYESNIKQEGSSTTIHEYNTQSMDLGFSYDLTNKLTLNVDTYNEKKESAYNYVTYNSLSSASYDYNAVKTNLIYEAKDFTIKSGYDYSDIQRDTSTNGVTKESNAGYIIGNYNLGTDSLKAGLRYETVKFLSKGGDNQDDNLWGAELGYNHAINKNTSILINYAHTYQSANVDRLFKYSTGAFTGYVKPSESDSFNLGFNHIKKNNKLKISAFYMDLKNEIFYYSDPTFANSRNTNIDKSFKYGLDIYDKWIINDNFNIVLNYNYVKAIIDEEVEDGNDYAGNHLPGVSDHNIKATLSYLPNKNSAISLTQVYRSKAFASNDFGNNFTQKQDAYKSTNVSMSYKKENIEFFAKINNIFNQKNGLWIKNDSIYPVNFTTTAIVGFKLKI